MDYYWGKTKGAPHDIKKGIEKRLNTHTTFWQQMDPKVSIKTIKTYLFFHHE